MVERLADDQSAPAGLSQIQSQIGAHQCSNSLELGGKFSIYCYWKHADRSAAARAHFGALLMHCGWVRKAPAGAGKIVNHPDSDEQQRFDRENQQLSVALKDKGQLQQTLLFISMK